FTDITTTLPFMRAMQNPVTRPSTPIAETPDQHEIIDTQAALFLSCGNVILLDLLAIHMVRSEDSSTIISYHPSSSFRRPSPKKLHSLVYQIFAQSEDPTFLFLAILWYALYAWDQAFESLYTHINWLVHRRIINVCCFS
ncbi:hypothetical protein DFJ58DRAFT_814163, partial [Suillus subalutaceus]|uniref:uncharacterized protein n=1 Tax=Suillus subalutaceus TaxID=48586 RepID=UPI001B868F52